MKKQFLESLAYYLRNLEPTQREDILAFYEERFELGVTYEGKTESEIVNELESPQQIAKNVLREFNQYDENLFKKAPNQVEPAPLIGIILLDIFFISWFLPMIFAIFGGLVAGWGALFVSMFTPSFIESSNSVLGSYLFIVGIVIVWMMALLALYDGLRQFVYWVVSIHIKAFGRSVPLQVESFFNNISLKRWIRKSTQLRVYSRIVIVVGLASLMIGGFVSFAQTGMLGGFTETPEPYEVDYVFTPNDSDVLSLDTDLINAGITMKTHNLDTILIVGEVSSNEKVEIVYDHGSLSLVQEANIRIIVFNFNLRPLRQHLTVYVPETMSINDVNIKTTNSSITVENIDAERIITRTTNGSVTLNDVQSQSVLNVTTTNGRINISRSSAINYELVTTNGKIVLRNLNSPSAPGSYAHVKSTNGALELENVYIHQLRLKTTNGNIDYYNADRSFFVSVIDADTTNGITNINVPRK